MEHVLSKKDLFLFNKAKVKVFHFTSPSKEERASDFW